MKQWLVLACLWALAGWQCASAASSIWIHSAQPRAMSPLMTTASAVALPEADALGDFILSAVTATAETPAPDSWAEFTIEVPKENVYRLWSRVRFPAGEGEAWRIAPASGGREIILSAGQDARRWHWVDCGEIELPAGPWTFRVHPPRAGATTFGPLKWRKAELTQTPRLNVLCLSDDPRYTPTDADAQRALGLTKTKPPLPRVAPAKLAPLPTDGLLVPNRKRLPDWMRVPRWFTKDSWRDELRHRRAGDIAALVREVAANGGQTLRLSIFWGGEVYYQSRVAPHAPGLGRLDYLREAMDEAARTGGKIVVYMNPNALVAEHPLHAECVIREPDGRLSQQPAYGRQTFPNGSRYACVNHPRYRQFLRDVLTEIFSRYKPHGLYVDGLTPHACFCEHCRAKWRAMFGSGMPVEKLGKNPPVWAVWGEFGRDPQPVGDVENDPDARRWTEMMLRTLIEVTHEFSATVKKAKPDAITAFHSHPKDGCEHDYDGTLTEVYTPRPWVHIAWRSGELAGYSAVYHVPTLFNIYPHRHFTAAEARYHALQGLAAGAYPNFWSALGMKPVAEFMARCADCLDFSTTAPVKFIALPRDLRESDTQRRTPRAAGVSYGSRDRFLAPYVGAYSALMRSGLPVVTLHRPRFEEGLAGFKVLVLANVGLMSDTQVEKVRRFVRDGGGLIATHETSLYDEKGRRREEFALADVFGVRYKATLKPQGDDEPRVRVERAGAETMDWPSDTGGVLAHRFGRGRVVYLPGRPDSAQCYNPCAKIERLFAQAVRWVSQDNLPVELEAAGTVGVTLFRQPRRLIVHLVNHQRDSLFSSDTFEPVGKVLLRVSGPSDGRVQRVRRLWEDRDLPFEAKPGSIRVEVGRLDEYEAVAVEW
ncbi:MAG: beta-galactosidase [Verrucomicrobiae bacterium]|nr:beta-galactosidase [Verrucomicrobiae bacterium]